MISTKRRVRRKEFEEIALPHLDALYGAALRLTRDPRDAEDLVQDAMLRAYRFWDSFQRDSNCKAWLLKIVTNTFINSYQKAKRSREVLNAAVSEQEATDGVLVQERALSQRDPEGALLESTLSEDVANALASVPADFRMAVVLCDMQGLSYKEIADVMGCPVGTVMSRLYRGRRLLKKALHHFAVQEGIIRESEDASDREDEGERVSETEAEATGGQVIRLAAHRRGKNESGGR
jgi:RNA polymerase sigma-70 factor (ECF subfamily)